MKLSELLNLLKTAETVEEMDMRREEIAALIPAVRTMFGYDQKNSAHQYDLWMHSLHVVCNLPRRMENDMVYLAALLHDIGKPEAQCRGKREGDQDMHYYGHPEKSMEIVRDIVILELDRQGYAGIVKGSYKAARLLLGYNVLAFKISCADFSICSRFFSVTTGHGKLLYTIVFE